LELEQQRLKQQIQDGQVAAAAWQQQQLVLQQQLQQQYQQQYQQQQQQQQQYQQQQQQQYQQQQQQQQLQQRQQEDQLPAIQPVSQQPLQQVEWKSIPVADDALPKPWEAREDRFRRHCLSRCS
jgi:hypothetical protein